MADGDKNFIDSSDKLQLEDLSKSFFGVFKQEFYKSVLDSLPTAFSQMENAVISLSKQFGGGREMAQAIRDNFAGAATEVQQLGGNFEDVLAIQNAVNAATNTQTILNKDAYASLFATSRLIGGTTEGTSKVVGDIMKSFTEAGYGLYDVSNQMNSIINTARQLGVTTTALYGQLQKNMDNVNIYNFDNGVQGVAKMAAHAAMLRIDMSKTFEFAEKVFSPEGAIEAASAFQRLGVQVTELLDPYSLMDMARNRPEDLQKAILEVSQEFTYFDEKNKKISILPGAQERLRELGKELGYNAQEFSKLIINQSTFDMKMREMRFASFMTEEDKTLVANLAQMGEGGQYKIDVGGVQKNVAELKPEDLDVLKREPKETVDLQRESNGALLNIVNDTAAMKNSLSIQAAASKEVNQLVKGIYEQQNLFNEYLGKNVIGLNRRTTGEKRGLYDISGTKDRVDSFITYLNSSIQDLANGTKSLTEVISNAGDAVFGKLAPNLLKGAVNLPADIGNIYNDMKKIDPTYGNVAGLENTVVSINGLATKLGEIISQMSGGKFSGTEASTNTQTPQTPLATNVELHHTHEVNVNATNLDGLITGIINNSNFTSQIDSNINKLYKERADLTGASAERTG